MPFGMASRRVALLNATGSPVTAVTSACLNNDQPMTSLWATGQRARISSYALRWSCRTPGS